MLTKISSSAFNGCVSLKSVTIPNSLVEIKVDKDNPTFHSDQNTIIFTENNSLLQGCNTSTIPSYATIICGNAFYNCRSLKSVVIPQNVTAISHNAFGDCESLADIRYEGSTRRWNEEIMFGAYPFRNVAADVIHCKNGDVEISE